jgi:CubicO group peptidase (beta-lactamase class C family)
MAVIEDGRLVWSGAFGIRSTETGEPVDTETLFEAASMTKPVTATIALRFVDQGKLDLGTPLATYRREERYEGDDRYERLHSTACPHAHDRASELGH